MPVLQDILSNMAFADLPPAWTTFNLETFSRAKRLWDYQQEALQYALRALWKYYEEIADYWEGEPAEINAFRKEALWQWYVDNGLEENLDIPLDGQRREIRHLLESYYSPEGDVIPYRHLINRMGFWMATGSGKSLVLVKGGHFQADRSLLDAITPEMLLRLVYNAPSPGITEVMIRPSNRQEMAFKLKSADQPFALVKIGDISGWLKEELAGYEVVEGFEDEGFFRRLNEDDSAINILMGSRSFYEGWDSNRPNVITYINIGTGTEARKFILQSVGRGVRIEPVPGQRKRLLNLHSAGLIDPGTFHRLGGQVSPLETLFIFGTNRVALHTVIQNLSQEKRRGAGHEIARPGPSLTPIYQRVERAGRPRELQRFEITEEELALLAEYVEYVGDDCLLMAHHGLDPKGIRILRTCLREPERYFSTATGRRYGRVDLLLSRLLAHFRGILLPD
jgi:hypothetical protein